MTTKLIDIKSLSEVTGFSVRTLRAMAQKRKIPHFKLGHRTLRFDVEDVVRALAKFKVHAARRDGKN